MAKINMQQSMFATYSTKGYFPLPRNIKKKISKIQQKNDSDMNRYCTEKDTIRLCVLPHRKA